MLDLLQYLTKVIVNYIFIIMLIAGGIGILIGIVLYIKDKDKTNIKTPDK